MMFSLRKPAAKSIHGFLGRQGLRDFSYSELGQSRAELPTGYVVDHHRVRLGAGRKVFDAAVAALEAWRNFPGGWIEAHTERGSINVGENVAVIAKGYGVWSMWACRVVYRTDEDGSVRRVGFAYGTLDGHFAEGEERFSIEWHRDDDSVWYDILAFSRPRAIWAKLLYLLVRRMQCRFGRESLAAMSRIVGSACAEAIHE